MRDDELERYIEDAADDIAGNDVDGRASACQIFREWLAYALGVCNVAKPTPTILAIVKMYTQAAYNRRGDEGAATVNVGGQNITYEDLQANMRRDLIGAGQRVYRL